MIIREIGRVLVSLCLVGLVAFLFHLAFQSPTVAEAVGISGLAGVILGGLVGYWLKPS